MTDDERRERITAISDKMVAELVAKADRGEDLALEQAFILLVRALVVEIGDAPSILLPRQSLGVCSDLAAVMLTATAEIAVDREATRAAAPSPRPTLH